MNKVFFLPTLFTLFFTFVLFIRTCISVEILGIQAPKGSMQGGTYLTIWGSGFSRNGREGQTIA